MDLKNYLSYIIETVSAYPTNVKKYLVKKLIEKGYARKDKNNNQISFDSSIDISDKDDSSALTECINNKNETIKEIEKWEFIKAYKYSVIFECNKFDKVVGELSKKENLTDYENEYLFDRIEEPVFYKEKEQLFLKFNLKYAVTHPATQEELLLKYCIVVVFHAKEKLVEIRFDVLKKVFAIDQDSYINFIDTTKEYIEKTFDCKLCGMKLDYMVSVAKEKEDIKLIAQFMRLTTGGYAQLEVGNNKEYLLPLIGELKTIMADYSDELSKAPILKDALEQFLIEKEEMSDYPWIEVLWENDIKTRSNHVKFVFNYMNKEYGLIQYYYNPVLLGMERMNDVIKYIASNKGYIERKNKE